MTIPSVFLPSGFPALEQDEQNQEQQRQECQDAHPQPYLFRFARPAVGRAIVARFRLVTIPIPAVAGPENEGREPDNIGAGRVLRKDWGK